MEEFNLDEDTLNDLKLLRDSFKYYNKYYLIKNKNDFELFELYSEYSLEQYAGWIIVSKDAKFNESFIDYVENPEKWKLEYGL